MPESRSVLFGESHRPRLHFTASRNWINDPVGMVHFEGRYHLFYQYNPSDSVWGNMHWGHAVSTDLLHWQHRPVALHPDPEGLGYVFSGSAAVDWNNSSGLGDGSRPPLIALFTHCATSGQQVQSLAYSRDGGEHWTLYDGNPVLDNPGIADFRDPKLIRDDAGDRWLMALAVQDRIHFYVSTNLLDWTFLSEFGGDKGAHGGVWECPDLFPLTTPSGDTRWILIVSLNPGGPNGGSATQYFIGDFDGTHFTTDQGEALWLDFGPDNYAGVTWSDMPAEDGRHVMIGWMNNWRYANLLPTSPWRGAMTLPRQLMLAEGPLGLRLLAAPVDELAVLRQGPLVQRRDLMIGDRPEMLSDALLPPCWELQLSGVAASAAFALRLFNDHGEALELRFDLAGGLLEADRSRAGVGMAADTGFAETMRAALEQGMVAGIHAVVDVSAVEIWTEAGQALLTFNYFTTHPLDQAALVGSGKGGGVRMEALSIFALAPVWLEDDHAGEDMT